MPNYDYKCINRECWDLETKTRNVPISERENQFCNTCGVLMTRKYTFEGSVWAPTAGGMR